MLWSAPRCPLCENHPVTPAAVDASPSLEVLEKVDAVISALQHRRELSAQQIADLVHEPLSSTYRLLQSLSLVDWVQASPRRGLYRLGVYFVRVGGSCEDRLDVRREALAPLTTLRQRTGWTASLFLRRGTRAVCVERLESASVRSTVIQVGDSLPLDVGAPSLVLLAFLPDGERRSVVQQLDESRPATSPRPPEALEAALRQVRRQRFARSDGEATPGIADLAAPVFNHRGELVASIDLSGLSAPFLAREGEFAAAVRATAGTVSLLLGAGSRAR